MQTRAPRPLVLLLMIALSSAVQLGGARGVGEAAPWPWASHGPDGGSITALAVDPTNGDVAYAGTAYGGVFATHDAGLHWTSIGSGLPTDNPRIWSITVSPWAPGTVYVGLESADAVYDGESGLWETTDGGASWRHIEGQESAVEKLVFDPSDPNIMYVAKDTTDFGVYKTTDGGRIWTWLGAGVRAFWVYSIDIDPTDPSVLYASGDETWKTTDAGAHWVKADGGIAHLDLNGVVVDRFDPQRVYGYTQGSVYVTTDGAGTWSRLASSPVQLSALVLDPTVPNALYVAQVNYAAPGGVYRSTDGGATWTQIGHEIASSYVEALAADPSSPGVLWAGGYYGQSLFRTADGGASWRVATNGVKGTFVTQVAVDPNDPLTVWAVARATGLFKSVDGGLRWKEADKGLPGISSAAVALAPGRPGTVWAGVGGTATQEGVYLSTDGGESWRHMTNGFPADAAAVFAVDPVDPDRVFAGTYANGLYVTEDAGASWASTSLPVGEVVDVVIDPTNTQVVYAGSGAGVYKSTDGGSTWTKMNNGFRYPRITALAIDPSNPQTLYAGVEDTAAPIYKTVDGGATWTSIGNWIRSAPDTTDVTVSPTDPSTVYMSAWYGGLQWGVLVSHDAGESWHPMNAGLADRRVNAVALAPDGSSILVGTGGGGVFARTLT